MAGKKIDSTNLSDIELKQDLVFKALGEFNRRALISMIQKQPGITLTEITDHFEISRFAVMKHLNILGDAELIRREAEGKNKKLYYIHLPVKEYILPWLENLEG